jgi:GT2 family glycosyltransferase
MSEGQATVSVVIPTVGRKDDVLEVLDALAGLEERPDEVILVCNAATDGTAEAVRELHPEVDLVELDENLGTGARNVGFARATGDIVLSLDDDTVPLTPDTLARVRRAFADHKLLGALAFAVVRADDGTTCNWAHPRDAEQWSGRAFRSTYFPAGAVAFRRSVLEEVGYYPARFFMCGQEDDLALRVLAGGYEIWYEPRIVISHGFSGVSRAPWRRDYFELRNSIWMAARLFPVVVAVPFTLKRTVLLSADAVRSGHGKWAARAVRDAAKALPAVLRERKAIPLSELMRIKRLRSEGL